MTTLETLKKRSSRDIWMMLVGVMCVFSPMLLPAVAQLAGGIEWLVNFFMLLLVLSFILVPVGIVLVIYFLVDLIRVFFMQRSFSKENNTLVAEKQ